MKTQAHLADNQFEKALKKYNSCYINHYYMVATKGKGVSFGCALSDEAMALCGSPFHKLSNRNWSEQALNFLGLFV